MRLVGILSLFIAAYSVQAASIQDPEWKSFRGHFNKAYKTDREEQARYRIFKKNKEAINKLNHTPGNKAHFGVNKFSDLDPKEFEMGYLNPAVKESSIHPTVDAHPAPEMMNVTAPASIDWSRLGATTPIKNQGACGSCWAFSATEQVESAIFMASKQLPNLSAQQLTSCDKTDHGCSGGWPTNAYTYMQSAGLETTVSYPYTSGAGANGTCNYNASLAVAHLTGYHLGINRCTDTACLSQAALEPTLQQVLSTSGPASIIVYATPWQSYSSGIMTAQICPGASNIQNHAVQLVGYDTDPATGKKYWIARNQWGSSWGMGGYIHLELGTNTCGMANFVTYVDGATYGGPVPTPTPTPPKPTPRGFHCLSCSPE